MKILFKNKTKYTEDLYYKYCKFHGDATFYSSNLYTIGIVILIIYCLCIQIKAGNYNIVFLFCCIFTAFILWRIFYPVYLGRRELNSDTITKEKEYTFTFYDKYFTIENNKSITDFYYNDLFKVRITKDYSYLYSQRRYAFILDNSCFTYGSFSSFKIFMRKKCKFKYKYYKNYKN